jgi:hypothetical protein
MSVLVDNKQMASNGKPYDFKAVNSKEEAAQIVKDNPNLICMLNGSPVLTEGQEGEAIEFMRGLMRAKYTLKEVDKGGTNRYDAGAAYAKAPATAEQQKLWSTNQGIIDEGNLMLNLYNGNQTQINSAMSHFGGDTRFNSIERTPDGIYITYKDPTIKDAFIPFFNPRSGVAFGTDAFLDAAKNALLYPKDFNLTTAKQGIKNKTLMPTFGEYNRYSDGKFTPIEDNMDRLNQINPGFSILDRKSREDYYRSKNQVVQNTQNQGSGSKGGNKFKGQ